MARRVKKRGTDRMLELGKTRVTVWLDAGEVEKLKHAAEKNHTGLATLLREVAVAVVDACLIDDGWHGRIRLHRSCV